jgi:hypothetical protein
MQRHSRCVRRHIHWCHITSISVACHMRWSVGGDNTVTQALVPTHATWHVLRPRILRKGCHQCLCLLEADCVATDCVVTTDISQHVPRAILMDVLIILLILWRLASTSLTAVILRGCCCCRYPGELARGHEFVFRSARRTAQRHVLQAESNTSPGLSQLDVRSGRQSPLLPQDMHAVGEMPEANHAVQLPPPPLLRAVLPWPMLHHRRP